MRIDERGQVMTRMSAWRAGVLTAVTAGVVVALGCASTTVKRNPGPHDHGVRYYRPKPFLLVSPVDGGTNQVKIELDYLPDYSEEYSIHVRAGIGTNKTHISLDDGWNLKQLNIDVDSKVSENIKAVAELLKAVPFNKAGNVPNTDERTRELLPAGMTVTAYDVPLGYYEAVVSRGADGVKRLYGWRYVGFAPFAACPLESTGVQCAPCAEADLFGLVTVGNKLYFRRLSELGAQQKTLVVEQVSQQPVTKDGTKNGTPGGPMIKP